MKSKYAFSKAEQGKFYHANAKFQHPIYLEPDVEEFLTKVAANKNTEIQVLVNKWLRSNIKSIQGVE